MTVWMPVSRCRPKADRMYVTIFRLLWKNKSQPSVFRNMTFWMLFSRHIQKTQKPDVYSATASLSSLCAAVCKYNSDPAASSQRRMISLSQASGNWTDT